MTIVETGEEYVGQTNTIRGGKPWSYKDRAVEHYREAEAAKVRGCHKLNCAIRLHGRGAFTIALLEEVPAEEGNAAEIRWIAERDTFDGDHGLNMTPGE